MNVLLPDDFIEYIFHVVNSHVLHTIIQCCLILGGKSLKKEMQAVFFTAVNPMCVDQHEEVGYDLNNTRIAAYKKTWNIHQNTVYWCNLKVAQKKGLQFLPDTIRRNRLLQHFTCDMHRESGEHEVRRRIAQQSVSISKVTAKSCAQAEFASWQDRSNLEARTSVGHQSKESEEYGETRSEEFEETRSGNIGCRAQGLPHSTVQKEDDVRRETVKKLIHQFETHPNRESLMADLNKNQKINLFSEKLKELIRSFGNTEYFEMCEITPNTQCTNCMTYWPKCMVILLCPDCSLFWEIVFCTCGKCPQPSQRNRQLNKEIYLSIPNCVIKKNPSRGARHGRTEDSESITMPTIC